MILLKRSAVLFMMTSSLLAGSIRADGCPQLADHTAAGAIRQIAEVLYAPFADYPFKPGGVCVDPAMFQVLVNVYFPAVDESSAPKIESFCIDRPADGDLRIRWSLGPTPQAALLVSAGQNEEIVRSHDFWHVNVPSDLICSARMKLKELIFERDGEMDIRVLGESAQIRLHGISMSMALPGSKLPGFLLDDLGVDRLSVDEAGNTSAKFSAPLFNIPVEAVGDVGPDDSLSVSFLGIRFRVR